MSPFRNWMKSSKSSNDALKDHLIVYWSYLHKSPNFVHCILTFFSIKYKLLQKTGFEKASSKPVFWSTSDWSVWVFRPKWRLHWFASFLCWLAIIWLTHKSWTILLLMLLQMLVLADFSIANGIALVVPPSTMPTRIGRRVSQYFKKKLHWFGTERDNWDWNK